MLGTGKREPFVQRERQRGRIARFWEKARSTRFKKGWETEGTKRVEKDSEDQW